MTNEQTETLRERDRAPYGRSIGWLQDPYQGEWRHPDAEPLLPSLDEVERSLCVSTPKPHRR